MRSENMAKIALNAVRLPKFEPVIVVAEKDHGKRFTATFQAGVILRMRYNQATDGRINFKLGGNCHREVRIT